MIFNNLIGEKISAIQRLDSNVDYNIYSTCGIILTLENHNEKLLIGLADAVSVDIKMMPLADIEAHYGLEFGECVLNDLKKDDDLSLFIGNTIHSIKVAEYYSTDIKGPDFVIKQGTLAGIEMKTDKHKLLFRNNYGGWYDIDDDVVELPNRDRWEWK